MKAIIWKELRENFKWAILCLLGMSAAFSGTLYHLTRPLSWSTESFVDRGVQSITICGSVVVALMLGLMQTLPEMRRDRWAFFTHRPLTRTRLFFGKVVAGLLLYTTATLLPFLIAGAWAAMPGHMAAPVTWPMLLPGVADYLAGVTVYFAAMLIGIRQVRWYGSRLLPAGIAAIALGATFVLLAFWQAALVSLVSAGILMTAAWGGFVTSGQYRSQPWPAKAALGFTLCAGTILVGVVAALIGAELFIGSQPSATNRYYEMGNDERVLRVTVNTSDWQVVDVTDLDGKPVGRYKDVAYRTFIDTECLRFSGLYRQGSFPIGSFRSPDQFLRVVAMEQQNGWYYVSAWRTIVGYDEMTRKCVGTVGPDGFRPVGVPPAGLFPGEPMPLIRYDATLPLVFPSGVYEAQWRDHRVRLIMAATREHPIIAVGRISTGLEGSGNGPIGVASDRQIRIFSPTSQDPVVLDLPAKAEDVANIQAAILPSGGYAIRYSPKSPVPGAVWDSEQMVVFSADGALKTRYDLPSLDPVSTSAPLLLLALAAFVAPVALVAAMAGGTLVVFTTQVGFLAALKGMSQAGDGSSSIDTSYGMLVGGAMLVGAMFWALTMYAIGRRYAFTRRQLFWWTLSGFMLGPAGLLTMLAMREWPARIACPSCGRLRVVNRERCEHCDNAFPPPAMTGMEILENDEAAGAVLSLP